MKVKIRTAKKEDLKAILDLLSELDIDNYKVLDLQSAEKILNRIQSYPNYNIYVAVINNEIIGTFELLIMDNLAHSGMPSGILEDVVVRPDFRGQGIGRKMMRFAIKECKKAKCYKLMLSSNIKRIHAHKFYESLNFKKHGYSYEIRIDK